MKMPVLADLRRTQQELSLALAELDNIEAAVTSMDRPGPGAGDQGASSQVSKIISIQDLCLRAMFDEASTHNFTT